MENVKMAKNSHKSKIVKLYSVLPEYDTEDVSSVRNFVREMLIKYPISYGRMLKSEYMSSVREVVLSYTSV